MKCPNAFKLYLTVSGVSNATQPPWVTQQQQSSSATATQVVSQDESTNPLMMGSNANSTQQAQRHPVAPAQSAYVPTSTYYPGPGTHNPGQATARNPANPTTVA